MKADHFCIRVTGRSAAWYFLRCVVRLLWSGETNFCLKADTPEKHCVFEANDLALTIFKSGKAGDIHIDKEGRVYRHSA